MKKCKTVVKSADKYGNIIKIETTVQEWKGYTDKCGEYREQLVSEYTEVEYPHYLGKVSTAAYTF